MAAKGISEAFIKKLPTYANTYIEECLENKKEVATPSGRIIKVMDRHIPTIQYFLMIWLPKKAGKTIHRDTWYTWIKLEESDDYTPAKNKRIKLKADTIKKIDALFNALSTDIVANEGKGIFYAKNKLGMTDKVSNKVDATVRQVEPITGMNIVNEPQEGDE